MADTTLALQKAIIAALRADAAVAALVGARVYSAQVPEDAAYPLITVVPELAGPWDAVLMDGWECLFRVSCWSRTQGHTAEAAQIAAAVFAELHNVALPIDGAVTVLGRMLEGSQRTLVDPDAKTVGVVARYRYLTHA